MKADNRWREELAEIVTWLRLADQAMFKTAAHFDRLGDLAHASELMREYQRIAHIKTQLTFDPAALEAAAQAGKFGGLAHLSGITLEQLGRAHRIVPHFPSVDQLIADYAQANHVIEQVLAVIDTDRETALQRVEDGALLETIDFGFSLRSNYPCLRVIAHVARFDQAVQAFRLAKALRSRKKAEDPDAAAKEVLQRVENPGPGFFRELIRFGRCTPGGAKKKIIEDLGNLLDELKGEHPRRMATDQYRMKDQLGKRFIELVVRKKILVDWIDQLDAVDDAELALLLSEIQALEEPKLWARWERQGTTPASGKYFRGVSRETWSRWMRTAWRAFAPAHGLKNGPPRHTKKN